MKLIAKTQIVGLHHDDLLCDGCLLCDLHRIRYVRLFLLRYDHHVCFLYLQIDDLCLGD
jgi:hypothetical protein